MPEVRHKVELVFDSNTGELIDVNPGDGGEKFEGQMIEIDSHGNHLLKKPNNEQCRKRLHWQTLHTFSYGYGSPGCVTYRTSSGYVTICY
jgi:hypothetical protein